MKVRNIFIGCLSLLMAFTACNEEIIIENEGIETASFSLSFLLILLPGISLRKRRDRSLHRMNYMSEIVSSRFTREKVTDGIG